MARRSLTRTQSSKLLKTLLNNPQLPTFVKRLEAPTLHKLINCIGLDDAGPLIEYTTDRQLRLILDDSLWSSLAPGQPEIHRPEQFIRWLYVLYEQGEEFLAQRLIGLGLDYVVLNFAQLITVDDSDAILAEDYEVLQRYAGPTAYAEDFNGRFVTALDYEQWDITRAALSALQTKQPEFLTLVLSRCCHPSVSYLMHDTTGERRDAKEKLGYVTPESANAFLKLTNLASLASLIDGENHDPVSARYFSQLGVAAEEDEPDGPEADDNSGQPEEAEQTAGPDDNKLRELEQMLVDAEIVSDEFSGLLLPAPEYDDVLPVKMALDGLQKIEPELFSLRLRELVYLSNVLISGTSLDGKRFDEIEAAHAVLASCNLGMSYLGQQPGDDEAVRDGLVRLFRIGWQILQQIPLHAADKLVTSLRSQKVTKRLLNRRWILSEVDATLDELIEQVGNARFTEAKNSLFFISLVIEQETCDVLQALIDDYPRYPFDETIRHVESMADISNINRYLTTLCDHAKP
ncbi:MAG: DUF6178 family protein [Gammaproteobacteria bacterium]|nr:DUF6178 family protein [Gammaproteobacteria bacterium]